MLKIIDEKGGLFGKINIIDFLIIVFILIIIPVSFHVYKIMQKAPTRVPLEWVKVEAVTFTLSEVANLLRPGDVSHDEFGNPDGKIIKLLKKDDVYSETLKSSMFNKYMQNENGEHVVDTRYTYRIPVFMKLELLSTQSSKKEPYYFRRQPLFISLDHEHSFIFKTEKYSIRCYAIKIED